MSDVINLHDRRRPTSQSDATADSSTVSAEVHTLPTTATKFYEYLNTRPPRVFADHVAEHMKENLECLSEAVGSRLAVNKNYGVVMAPPVQDTDLGELIFLERTINFLRFVVSDNVPQGFSTILETDEEQGIDLASLYASAYVAGASLRVVPKRVHSSFDRSYWTDNGHSTYDDAGYVEPFRFAAGALQIYFGTMLNAEVPENNNVPLHVLSLANPMTVDEVRIFASVTTL